MNNFEDFEQFVRDKLYRIHNESDTNLSNSYIEDYLHLLNRCTIEEENEIRKIIENIISGLERITEIQDDCYSR